ncbi:MAG: hypothetical protein ABI249_03930 [Ornithinibacter sp.]
MTTADTPASGDGPSRPAQLAAYAAVWGFGFLLLRVFAVSGYDWDTAYLVSTTLGLGEGVTLLFGSLMAGHLLTALLLVWVLPLLIAAALWGAPGRRPALILLAALSTVLLVALTVSFHSWWLPPAALVLLAVFALIHRLPPEHRVRGATARVMARVGVVTGLAVLLVAAFVQTPWVPHERIVTTDRTITGYVLSVDPGFLNVLTDDHEFVILVSADVLSRS